MSHKESYNSENIRDLVDLYLQTERNDFKDNEFMDGKIMKIKCILEENSNSV